jgi:hypothetical protein
MHCHALRPWFWPSISSGHSRKDDKFQHWDSECVITAHNTANKESCSSNLVTFTPSSSAPRASTIKSVTQSVVGDPTTGPWGVAASTTDLRDVKVGIYMDGVLHNVESSAPYSFPIDNGTARYGVGWHTVAFVFYLENTTTEIGRASITLREGSQNPILKKLTLTLVGDPAKGPWGVAASTTDLRDITATIRLDQTFHHVDNYAPYSFPSDNGTTVATARYGVGLHMVEYVFYLQNTLTEIGRVRISVQEGSS